MQNSQKPPQNPADTITAGAKLLDNIIIPADYSPENDESAYMNPIMLEYFRLKLIHWKNDLLVGNSDALNGLQNETTFLPDVLDRATSDSLRSVSLRTKDRERKLIIKIEEALDRIHHGVYGYCEETDEPIGVKRLLARPTATLCIKAQERHEWAEKNQD